MTAKQGANAPSASGSAEELEFLKRKHEKRKARRANEKEQKNGLTSMIDIVFLLIFFFMVVTDLQKMEIEEIDLPFAVEATAEPPEPPKRVIVNVKPNGEVGIMGWTFDSEGLFEFLRRAAADGPHDPATNLPELAVKIRADKAVEYEKVQDVMVQCMRSKLWKVSFGTQPELDEKGLMLSPELQ